VCDRCAGGRRALTLATFAALLDGKVRVEAPEASGQPEQSPYAVLSAEIALLHARLDDLQSRLDH
jgi:hypothetical protein